MAGPLLLDFTCLCDAHTDEALEGIYKAISEGPPDNGIWEPHPNPFIRRIVELFTARGLERIAGLQDELDRWLNGEEHVADMARPDRPPGAMARWSRAELALVRLYLQSLAPSAYTLDDWLMVVDYLVQRYLPEDDLRTEAEWLATRAAMMGRVEAAMGSVTDDGADMILAALPATAAEAARVWGAAELQRAVFDYGSARCAESVTALADGARHRMRQLVVDHQQNVAVGNRAETSESLQTKLLDTFGTLNRDWRRIAVTEAGENSGQGFVAAQPAGSRVKRVEKYKGACAFCRSIDGKVMTVVDPSKAKKDGALEIWAGKTNIGRSASPRKREFGVLVDRGPEELWWIASGVQHPHCRGSWVNHVEGVSADPQFDAWLEELSKKGRS